MAIAYLLVGVNLDNTPEKYDRLSKMLHKQIGTIVCSSRLYHSEAWGFTSLHGFVNRAIAIETALSPEQLLNKTQDIERLFGRKPNTGNGYQDRSMEIDIIFYDDVVMNTPTLQLPHPRMHLRNFVLKPVQEIAPQHVHPVLLKTVAELSSTCQDKNHCSCPV
jgi:2-amino-4-hydroxy-6-hydroxymethyldihydropteridine diphosphokinase